MKNEQASSIAGDRAALEGLYRRHVGRGVALARVLMGDDHLAHDVAHDAFLRATARFAHLRNPNAFDGYYRRAVLNECRMRFRRQRVEMEWLRRNRPVTDTAKQPYDPVERDAVWSVIARLPFRQRAVLVLRYYEDLSLDQAAVVLRCSTRAARSLHTRAIETLRSEMEGPTDD